MRLETDNLKRGNIAVCWQSFVKKFELEFDQFGA